FCLAWANENWTRRWDGQNKKILMRQTYPKGDIALHVGWLQKAFSDRRYIRVDGKPLFLIYKPGNIDDAESYIHCFRGEARRQGIGEIFLCKVELSDKDYQDPRTTGFDGAVRFSPDWSIIKKVVEKRRVGIITGEGGLSRLLPRFQSVVRGNYGKLMNESLQAKSAYQYFPTVLVSWDNTSRWRERALIIEKSTPALYEQWLESAVNYLDSYSSQENKLLFINAWNEWGEGNHLEPCQQWGREYLDSTKKILVR
ncbi:MAG: glycoside hydrolase family 99-like domain-containing protein, partial [Patescibacteria group bacterium]